MMLEDYISLPEGSRQPMPEPAGSDREYVKHVICEGARFHTPSWDTLGERCSEERCIVNKGYPRKKAT